MGSEMCIRDRVGGGQTDDAGRAEMEESMTEHRKWSGEKGEM